MKRASHPKDDSRIITFEPRYHTYTDNRGQRYLSGTQLLKKFTPKFDAVAISEKCAAGKNPKYAGRKPEEIRAEWKAEGERGRNEGDNLHSYVEALLKNEMTPFPISERCERLFYQGELAVKKLLARFEFIAAEMIIFSPELGIAGMIDLLLMDRLRNEIVIGDWKQNKEIDTENQHQTMLPPIDHLPSAALHQYTLQLSLYQFLLEKEGYFNVAGYRRALIHITPETNKAIPLDNYRYEIMEMLKHESRI